MPAPAPAPRNQQFSPLDMRCRYRRRRCHRRRQLISIGLKIPTPPPAGCIDSSLRARCRSDGRKLVQICSENGCVADRASKRSIDWRLDWRGRTELGAMVAANIYIYLSAASLSMRRERKRASSRDRESCSISKQLSTTSAKTRAKSDYIY